MEDTKTPNPDVPWELVSQVKASRRRKEILEFLSDKPTNAADLAEELELARGTVSNHFRWLKKRDPPLIECLTPYQPHHRIYGLTEEGAAILDYL